MKNRQIQKISLLSLMTASSIILSYVESCLPPLFSEAPGIKIGLPNIIIIWILYHLGFSCASIVSLIRIILTNLFFGNPISFIYSFAGASVSLLFMFFLKKMRFLSVIGISVAGGIFHNMAQIFVAMLMLETAAIGYYIIILAFTGTVSGIFVGLCSGFLIRRFSPNKFVKGVQK